MRRAVEHDAPGLQDVGVVGDIERALRVLLDQQHRHLHLVAQFCDHLIDPVDDQRREAQRRLVERQQHGIRHQRAADRQHLLLAAGHVACDLVAPFEQAREQREHFFAPLARLRCGLGVAAHLQVFVDGQRRKHAAAFRHLHDAAPYQFIGREMMHFLVAEADRAVLDHAFLGVENPRHRLQQRRLAGAIGAEQGDDAAFGNRDADVADRLDGVVVDDADVAEFEQA